MIHNDLKLIQICLLCCLHKHSKMNQYCYITAVYFNNMSPPFEFEIANTSLVDLKFKLENFLHNVDNEGKIKFNKFELNTNTDVSVM